ncbi:DUF4260 domain-containing protein [Aestuariivirga sp.]|uniref:DUF4260 domain-containing protein n=1 Tax=Aestuariivirga sp. TaxID=2650926 RepID=UPI0035931048
MVDGIPRLILRLEGLALLAAGIIAFSTTGQSWWLSAILFLVPDLSFAAYLFGPRVGAMGYNLLHSTVLPLTLGIAGFLVSSPVAMAVAAIWLSHIGFDRALGYGLKYPTAFHDTHLGRIGKR